MELYLIAHKVRGALAFDIAAPMECPLCHGGGCAECAHEGHWWIVPTSGHRAHPFWSISLLGMDISLPEMPTELRDHYHLSGGDLHKSIESAPRNSIAPRLEDI